MDLSYLDPDKVRPSSPNTLFWTALRAIHQALNWASLSWIEIADHLDQLLGNQNVLLKPEDHDNLLFDKDDFSRSRTCFWVISSVDAFELSITDAIDHWPWYYSTNIVPLTNGTAVNNVKTEDVQAIAEIVKKIEGEIRRLKDSRERFKSLRERGKTLRDGVSAICFFEILTSFLQ